MVIVHSYVSLPEGIPFTSKVMSNLAGHPQEFLWRQCGNPGGWTHSHLEVLQVDSRIQSGQVALAMEIPLLGLIGKQGALKFDDCLSCSSKTYHVGVCIIVHHFVPVTSVQVDLEWEGKVESQRWSAGGSIIHWSGNVGLYWHILTIYTIIYIIFGLIYLYPLILANFGSSVFHQPISHLAPQPGLPCTEVPPFLRSAPCHKRNPMVWCLLQSELLSWS